MSAASYIGRVAVFLGTAATVLLPSTADGHRDLFSRCPFRAGQVWEPSTCTDDPDTPEEDGHWPDEDSVDLAQRDDDGDNISEGEPVLASADGVVDKVDTTSGGEHRVYLDHGSGWKTYYIHLETKPKLTIGQLVT